MGPKISWLAVRGKDAATVRGQMELRAAGEPESMPASRLAGAELPGGWTLILSTDPQYADSAPLDNLANDAEVVTCCGDEELMYSSASGWLNGRRLWYVVHDGQIGIQHFHVDGDPPPEFHAIYNRLAVVQAEAGGINITVDHVFEVPIQLAKALTGFRHDEIGEGAAQILFERLQ